MEAAELDVALEELETRLERLRALYEQYFMGLEKIEPAIARKDVDRRIYVLRREKIRNTAKRFKLQTLIQRYNTFQQYWQRICREIENGTYKRHLLRAQKNGELLTIAARKRLGKQALASEPPEAAVPPGRAVSSLPPSAPAPEPAVPAPAPIPQVAATPPSPGAPPPPRRPPLPSRPGALPGTAPNAPPKPAAPAAAKFESLDLDMDFMSDWDPGSRPTAAKPSPASGAKPPPGTPPTPPSAKPAVPSPKVAATPPGAPPRVQPLPKPPGVGLRPASVAPAPVAAPPRPASSQPPKAPVLPRAPMAPRVPPAPPPAAPPVAVAPAPARPRPPAPAPAPAPAAPVRPPAAVPAPAKPAASGGVDDARLRDLHSRLQQAKQQTKEANVSFEGLAKSIRATEAKLREQHKNRKIEFDVVIKDGKAVVKPIVR